MPETKLATAEIVARTLHRHLGGDWGEDQEDAALAVVEALRAAGRLLPEGGQTRTEWGVRSPKEKDYLVDGFDPDEALFWARREVRILRDRDQEAALIRRSTHAWPDGTTFTGPWVAVDQEATDG